MRLAFDSRRLIGRARGVNGWTLLELGLLALDRPAMRPADLGGPDAGRPARRVARVGHSAPRRSTDMLGSFDPFFRLSGAAGPVMVTSLNLKLYGIRQDQVSGPRLRHHRRLGRPAAQHRRRARRSSPE
jgi:general secretion pathway protein C